VNCTDGFASQVDCSFYYGYYFYSNDIYVAYVMCLPQRQGLITRVISQFQEKNAALRFAEYLYLLLM
jgi:hypothetical protein